MIDSRSTRAYKLEKENRELKKEIEVLRNGNDIAKIINDNVVFLRYQREQQEEIKRLNNIINKTKQELLNKKEIIEESKYFKLVYYIDWNMQHTWDKRIVCKIDEIINIIDEVNK